jgi:hypothetical protein
MNACHSARNPPGVYMRLEDAEKSQRAQPQPAECAFVEHAPHAQSATWPVHAEQAQPAPWQTVPEHAEQAHPTAWPAAIFRAERGDRTAR